MNLTTIVFNNIRRRKNRVAFLVLGLVISTTTAVSLFVLGRGMTEDIHKRLDEFGANMVIVPASEGLTLSYGGVTVSGVNSTGRDMRESDLERLKGIRNAGNISLIAPKLAGQVTIKSQQVSAQQAIVAGVRFAEEFRLKKWWALSSGRKPGDRTDVVLGAHLAKLIGASAGTEADLNGKTVTIRGILEETGDQDDGLVFADLGFTQELLGKPDAISLAEISALCADCPIEDMVSQVTEAIPGTRVKAMKETLKLKMAAAHQFHSFAYGVSSIILLVTGLIVLTTMMSSVGERKKEIGLFRAVGYRRSHIMTIVLLEAGLLGLLGGLIGFALGSLLPHYIAPYLMHASGVEFHLQPLVGAMALLASAGTALAAGIYPAVKAANLDPAEALRDL